MKPILVTIPHSGEKIPAEVTWLTGLDEPTVMCDVDRFIDRLYIDKIKELKLPYVLTEWHRYVVDLNRLAGDVDEDSVRGSSNKSGSFTTGLHWVKTTTGVQLMNEPISADLHASLVQKYFQPFHTSVESIYQKLREQNFKETFHLDLHSMPSVGTAAHRDPGQLRSEIVVSDFNGKSSSSQFKDLVIEAYREAGFKVGYNWPYIGGRVTQQYGLPEKKQHAIQVELRRNLYMNEETKQLLPNWREVALRLGVALESIVNRI